MSVVLGENGRVLYAVAFNRWDPGARCWRPGGIEYTKASDAREAQVTVRTAHSCDFLDIIACAPAVGAFLNEETGEITA